MPMDRRWTRVLVVAACAFSVGCASGGSARPRPFPTPRSGGGVLPPRTSPPATPGATDAPAPPLAAPLPAALTPEAAAVLDTAIELLGTPYRDGGSDSNGFDCSGFVQWVYARHGVRLPRSVAAQFVAGTAIASEEVRGGDLLFFTTTGPGATHVAIALGDGRFVHAPSSRGVVRVEAFGGSYWPPRFLGARRVLPAPVPGSSLPQ